ncbi:unnamed protein product [Heterobilharzia americana]|nr:unnamed protein product [Heterobilharzia americana]
MTREEISSFNATIIFHANLMCRQILSLLRGANTTHTRSPVDEINRYIREIFGSISMQLLLVNDLWMLVADIVVSDGSLKNVSNTIPAYVYALIVLSCVLLAAILNAVLIFVEKLRNSFPANLFVILLAVILLSISATIVLNVLCWWQAVIVLSVTIVIFIVAMIASFFSKNLTNRGWIIFMSISGGLLVIGVIAASFAYFLKELLIVTCASWSVGLAIVIFITMIYLRYARIERTFSVVSLLAYILWFEETGLCLSLTQCFMPINFTQNASCDKDLKN